MLRKFVTWVLSALSAAYAGARLMMDWTGRSTFVEDWSNSAYPLLSQALNWLFSTPWWVPAILMACVAAGIAYWHRLEQPLLDLMPEKLNPLSDADSLCYAITKHLAPRQDDVPEGFVRFCVGASIANVGQKSIAGVEAVLSVNDPKGWRFADEVFWHGNLNPGGPAKECYPIELRINTATRRLVYQRDGQFCDLLDTEAITYELHVTSENGLSGRSSVVVRNASRPEDAIVVEASS